MTRNADRILDESFLEIRAKLLEVAATLDRIDRAGEDCEKLSSERIAKRQQIDEAIAICSRHESDRAEQLQRLFSRPYAADWRKTMQV